MPYAGNADVFKIMKHKNRMTEYEAKFIVAQMVMGIGYLHMRNIIHRDLKLENVVMAPDGYIKVIDFGLSKILQPGSLAKSQCGTAAYVSPQVIHGSYDQNTDWWAVGIMTYEMLHRYTPFFDRNP